MKSFMNAGDRPPIETRNFEAMNKMLPLECLCEQHASIVPGMKNTWYEYIPEAYDGSEAVPLIIQLHGGGNDGYRWAHYTVWHKLAEEHNFIVVYPNSPDYGVWECMDRDVQYLYDLIEKLKAKYKIDSERIYMQGMSNGEMMTLAFSMKHPEILAAAGFTTGPSPLEMLGEDKPEGALPVIQMRGEKDVNFMLSADTVDVYKKRYEMNDLNRELWEEANEVTEPPVLKIEGKNNFLQYRGKKAEIIQWEIVDMGHREPPEAAQVYWDYLYSGYLRRRGEIVRSNPVREIEENAFYVCFGLGSSVIYKDKSFIPVPTRADAAARLFVPAKTEHFSPFPLEEMYETQSLYVPAELIAAAFDATLEYKNPGDSVSYEFKDGRRIELYAESAIVRDSCGYKALQKPCSILCGNFYVPVREFCADIMGKYVSEAGDVVCVTDHYAILGRYTARTLRKYLGSIQSPIKD